jgi:hypothetical protein
VVVAVLPGGGQVLQQFGITEFESRERYTRMAQGGQFQEAFLEENSVIFI